MSDLGWLSIGFTLAGCGIGAWFRFGPGARIGAVADAILGSPVVKDRSGGELDPGNPGLVHRVAQVEEAVVEFRHMTGLLTEVLGRVDNLEHRVTVVENGVAEKVAIRMEAAAALGLIRDERTATAEQHPGG